jgi:uncharacterized membrane protein YccC
MGVYGNRASSIGVNALLVMVLNIDRHHTPFESLITATYTLAGGVWYTALSLLLYSFRPYKLVQQALGDCIQATAGYMRAKAVFYSRGLDYDKAYRQLVESQVAIHEKQDLVRELLFKSRKIVQESTHVGRVLMMIFLDIIDLFERIMTSQQDYRMLHEFFDDSGLMQECKRLILDLAAELDEIGIAVMSGKASVENKEIVARIRQARADLERYKVQYHTPSTSPNPSDQVASREGAITGLSNILDSIDDLADRLHTLHGYTTYDRKLSRDFNADIDVDEFVVHEEVDRKLLYENLTIRSNIFRHSLRMSIATIVGYIISGFLPFGHGYWILLTIVVILKPAYSLTKRRARFVVSNHMLTSHIATLAYYAEPYAARYAGPVYEPVVDDIIYRLERTVDLLEDKPLRRLALLPGRGSH